ncbi:EutN/CcmL family microcompartment protein [Proteiniclasticum ruminis]|jgi:ethanolamine utilization protein EutN|uniref:EutN/CcmL family microcompartment protein n=1 Tax=Proteiniclasticum ruminis TaxID=398199 RepID=UPI0028A5DF6F|nr:EutN/CcmL family microcompartment protein [Proteiniclasticum ruminis]
MYLAEVKGNVVATTKDHRLVGSKLLIVQPMTPSFEPYGHPVVAVDTVGAGFRDRVLVATGGSARVVFQEKTPVDATIVAIIDSLEMY